MVWQRSNDFSAAALDNLCVRLQCGIHKPFGRSLCRYRHTCRRSASDTDAQPKTDPDAERPSRAALQACLLYTSILSASAFPVTAFGASDSTSTLAEVTAKFIDAENGKEIIQPETYSVTHEEKSPQEIENYTYVDYAESVEYVYSHKDLTYIIGYPDESVRPDASMTRAEAATVFYRLYDGEYPASVSYTHLISDLRIRRTLLNVCLISVIPQKDIPSVIPNV